MIEMPLTWSDTPTRQARGELRASCAARPDQQGMAALVSCAPPLPASPTMWRGAAITTSRTSCPAQEPLPEGLCTPGQATHIQSHLMPGSGTVAGVRCRAGGVMMSPISRTSCPAQEPLLGGDQVDVVVDVVVVAPRARLRSRCWDPDRDQPQERADVAPRARLRSRCWAGSFTSQPGSTTRRTSCPAQEPLPGLRFRGCRDLRRSGRLRAPISPHASGMSFPPGWRMISWP